VGHFTARARSGGVFEDLLDVDIDLPQEGRRDGVAVAFVGQDGGALLQAQRLENGFRYPVGQTVKRPDDNDPIVALVVGLQPLADGRDGFAIKGGRDMFGCLLRMTSPASPVRWTSLRKTASSISCPRLSAASLASKPPKIIRPLSSSVWSDLCAIHGNDAFWLFYDVKVTSWLRD
jgi:hypothetical protein